MPKTNDRKSDLEVEVIRRCVAALALQGKADRSSYNVRLDVMARERVLRYLAKRFGVNL